MLKIEKSAASTKFTNLMSFHAGRASGPMVLIDNLSLEGLKHYAMIGLEKSIRDILGERALAKDLTPEEVKAAVESSLGCEMSEI